MKRALIIGASRGLGLGLVGEHLARGWRITATVRTPSPELEALATSAAGRLAIDRVDITRPAEAKALAGRLGVQSFDLLFLNAGIMTGRGQPLAEVSDADIVSIFMTNAISPIRVADVLLDRVAPGGTVAFMSSILGSIGTNDDGRAELYRASKAALNSLIRSFRARHAARADLTVLALHPGVVRTSMGGPGAPLDIETSVKGVTDVLEHRAGSGGTAFVDYRNEVIPW
ncbi:MAG: SDR family oxidoreductase [Hyphomicrobiaceae bacterium]|nr:SDR family oxidoreductase [Hyphomicrobiaceae bacterium]